MTKLLFHFFSSADVHTKPGRLLPESIMQPNDSASRRSCFPVMKSLLFYVNTKVVKLYSGTPASRQFLALIVSALCDLKPTGVWGKTLFSEHRLSCWNKKKKTCVPLPQRIYWKFQCSWISTQSLSFLKEDLQQQQQQQQNIFFPAAPLRTPTHFYQRIVTVGK